MPMSRKFIINLCLCLLILGLFLARNWTRHGEILPVAKRAQVERKFRLLAAPDRPQLKSVAAATASGAVSVAPDISARSAIALDVESKKILWQKNADVPNYPASTTKIVTALVARELYDLDDVITVTAEDLQYGQNLAWSVGDQIRVDELLRSLLILSANEAGMMLADHAPRGYHAFVARMNAKAKELGLSQSSFDNPQGFDADDQRMSAHDLAIASLELLRDDFLREIVATAYTTISSETGKSFSLTNTNKLLTDRHLDYQVLGIKTGTTALANEALVSLLAKDGHQIIVVVLSAQMRYNDTIQIADYVFGNYVWQPAVIE